MQYNQNLEYMELQFLTEKWSKTLVKTAQGFFWNPKNKNIDVAIAIIWFKTHQDFYESHKS